MRTAVLALALAGCCEPLVGEPGDEQAQAWQPPPEEYGTGPVIDCAGNALGSLAITTRGATLRNCTVNGSIRIQGVARNGNDTALHEMSRLDGYVEWLRMTSPSFVTIEDVTIIGNGEVPLYIAPGVHHVRIVGVTVRGYSDGPMVYLDAESSRISIRNSRIENGGPREAIAIDASDHNVIEGNAVAMTAGGVFLYRNCGEAGNVRHTTPSHNVITGNTFEGIGEAVLLNARNGDRCYCGEDAGWDFGSSGSDLDHARFNRVENNAVGE